MLERLRTWLAKKLDPEMARNEMRYLRLMVQIQTAHRWLSEQPVSNAVTEWLMKGDANYWRKEGTPYSSAFKWDPDISTFREQLRRGEHLPKPVPDKTTAEEARANVERVDAAKAFQKRRAETTKRIDAVQAEIDSMNVLPKTPLDVPMPSNVKPFDFTKQPPQRGGFVPGDDPEQER